MADKTPELVGKKKFVVDSDAFFSAPRNEDDELAEGLQDVINDAAYFNSDSDKVRIVIGKNWDYREDASGKKAFSNNWSAPKVFQKDYLWLDDCNGPGEETGTGLDQKLEEKFVLRHDRASDDIDKNFPGTRIARWTMYTKTGIIDKATDKTYEPIILTNKTFFDHYHESMNPFTPADLDSMQPAGKAFFANYKTYYNERIDSSNFESTTGNLKLPGTGAPYIQNALPSIYSFLRLFVNKALAENSSFDLEVLTSYNLDPKDPESFYLNSDLLGDVYKTLLKNFSLETLLTLYGVIGRTDTFADFDHSKIIEKIVSTSFDNIDADSLFSDYFNEYTKILTDSKALKNPTDQYLNRMRALERMMTNLVFSPNTIKLLNKVDQYKKYFPFYAEIEFTANLDTELGDAMKKMYLTKFMSELVLNNVTPTEADQWYASWASGQSDWNNKKDFIDYSQEVLLKDLSTSADDEVSATSFFPNKKKTLDLPELLNFWITTDFIDAEGMGFSGIYSIPQQPATSENFSTDDLRNYMTFFRNDYSEPTNLDSDENVIFKKLFGSAFLAKILNIYKNKRRTYQEIMDGKPAYTEDLFYRIEKTRKIAGSDKEEIVQNILFPNTSELDIVKYVDTQLKYATYATYKYNVYAHRAVFGSKYRYEWVDASGNVIAAPGKRTLQTITYPPGTAGEGSAMGTIQYFDLGAPLGLQVGISETNIGNWKKYYATFNTVVEPSIILLEDKIFSTPDIMIMDKPPVLPDVNIIPYRAVNNRVKILITGASDRYRAKPVIMVQSDIEEFDKIKRAQLVVDNSGNPLEDGKVEFGSDDPVRTFQIFRTQEKPKTYQDFEPYQEINQDFFEEQILPNTKYYYTFRAIDDHGHVSNPTPVYEVELIDEKGAVKPIIRLVDMSPPKNKINTKACQKYIYLKPALQQLYFSDDPEIDGIFSNSEKKKRYKMRLTSKGSGKKIDINFSFKKEIKN